MTSNNLRLADSPLFDGLQFRELELIESATTFQELDSNEILFEEGDEGHKLYIIQSGLLGIYVKDQDGAQVQVETRGNNSVVGEMSCLTNSPRSATVKTLLPTKLLVISGEDFMSVAKGSPTLLLNINRVLANRLKDASRIALRHKGDIVILAGDLPSDAGQWFAQNFSIAISAVSAEYTLLVNPKKALENVPQLPSRLSIQSFLNSSDQLPEANPNSDPLRTVLALEPEKPARGNTAMDLSPFHEAIGRASLSADYIIVNLTDLVSSNPFSLVSTLTPDLLLQVAQIVWVAEGDKSLSKQGEQARQVMEELNLSYDKLSWILLKDTSRPTQGDREAWANELGGKLISVVPSSSVKRLMNGSSSWAKGDVWRSLVEAGRHICHRTVGVAFGGGGARGFAHIGVIQGFEEIGLSVDYIAGTSAGSIIGGLWALGETSDSLKQKAEKFQSSWASKLLFVPTLPFRSILWGRGLRNLAESLVGESTFDDTFVPFGAVASHISTNNRVVFRKGLISNGLIASSSIPVVFPPFRLNGRLLVDGGQVEPVPVPTLKLMGADKIIAINFQGLHPEAAGSQATDWVIDSSDIEPVEEPSPNVLGAYFSVFEALRDEVAHNAVMAADISLRPEFESRQWYEISRRNEFIEAGHKSVHKSKDELFSLFPWLGRKSPGS